MKRLSTLFTLILALTLNIAAQGVNLSLTLTDDSGALQPSTDASLRMSLLMNSSDGDACYIETHKVTSNPYGVVNTTLGGGTVVAGNWEEIDWSVSPMYLKVERADASGNYNLMNILPLGAVPYAYLAKKAEKLTLTSPNGSAWDVTVNNDGSLGTSMVVPADAPEYGTVDYIFDLKALPTITIEITTEEWNTLLHNYDLNRDNEECVHANFYFNKYGRIHKIEDMGLRLRGNTSRVRPEGNAGENHVPGAQIHHVHFGFRFQKYHKDDETRLLSGTDRFNLRWSHGDCTYVHEMYGFDLMRRFNVYTTAKASYCTVYLKFVEEENPVYLGVSEMFECYEDQYLADQVKAGNLKGDKGFLWKGSWGSGVGADFTNASRNLMGIENSSLNPDETETYTYDYKSKKKQLEAAKDQLESFITNLNNLQGDEFRTWVENAIDIDLMLKAFACEVAIGHWDNLWCNGNNFYIYFDNDGDGKMKYLPYDLDNTLGTSSTMFDAGTHDPLKWGHSPLANKVLQVPEWRNKFIDYLYELANENNDYLNPAKSAERIRTWHKLIKSFVPNDTGEDNYIIDSPAWGETKHYRLLEDNNNFFKTKIESIHSVKK